MLMIQCQSQITTASEETKYPPEFKTSQLSKSTSVTSRVAINGKVEPDTKNSVGEKNSLHIWVSDISRMDL